MSIPALYSEVIYGLLLKTKENCVTWSTTTDSDSFIVYFNKFSLSIKQIYGSTFNNYGSREEWFNLELINKNGDKIDGFTIDETDEDFAKIKELYTLARRSALSIDTAIQEMLTELNKDGVIGKKKKDNKSSNNDDSFSDDIPF